MILGLDSPRGEILRHAGGKGGNLWLLSHAGAPVPRFFVIGAPAFERFLAGAGIDLEGEDLERRIEAARVPDQLGRQIRAAFAALGARRVAVRSSALAEDSVSHSFAGQLRTYLHVERPDAVIDAVRGCWASQFSAHALAYMRQNQLRPGDARVAVVVQEMVDAERAGVVFTLDPVSGARDRIVISAVHGLGEGLVSGLLDADTYHLDRYTRAVVSRTLARKTTRLVRGAGGGVREEPVPVPDQDTPALDERALADLCEASLAIERQFGRPQDIEWATAGGELFILQARPITTTAAAAQPIQVWDNANIVESYAGVTSPLTFTFARNAYYQVYVQFCQVMGVRREVVAARDHMLRNMLGYIEGRVYYNLINWYNLVGLFPGFSHNRQFMEGMMGVRESLPEDAQALLVLPGKATLRQRLGAGRLALVMAGRFLRLRRTVGDFRAYFDRQYAHYKAIDVRQKTWEELLALYRELDDVFLKSWKAPIVNDFFAMMMFGLLRKWTALWKVDETGGLQNDLLCGEGGVESAVPTETLMELAQAIRDHEPWRRAFAERQVAELRALSEEDARFAGLKARIDDYLDQFGFRCMNELKLEEPDLTSDPTFVYQSLKNYVVGSPPTLAQLRRREQEIRRAAEARARAALGPVRRRLYFWVLRHARATVKNRENLRLCRTRVFGLVRRIMDAAGADLVIRGRLDSARDVYFLTIEELEAMVDGTLVTQDLRALVDSRRRDRERFLASEPDERFVTRGAVYLGNRFRSERAAPADADADGVLRGIGCCPGQVTARAKVIVDPKGDLSLDGHILVARRTDPGWTPLFPSASGILVERGSLLSHSAIVARELGLPCVVAVPGLLDRVKTGDLIEMDGAAGWARIIPPDDARGR